MSRRLQGRIALVTGAGRERSIGAAICRALAAEGADIFFTYWQSFDRAAPWGADEDLPGRLKEEILALGVRCEEMEVDLVPADAPVRLLDCVEERLGLPAVLVNNAAYSTSAGFDTLDASTLDTHYAVNLRAPVLLSAEFARRRPAGPGGRIITLTSGQSLGPMPEELAYVASKGGMEAFSRTLAAEVGPKGITVNCVNPGPTDTGWMTPDLKAHLLPKFALGRIGQAEDAARLVVFLASDEGAWITGQTINSEGGFARG